MYKITSRPIDSVTVLNSVKDPAVKKSWEMQRDKARQELAELDDALCRTEIITKFDLMEFD